MGGISDNLGELSATININTEELVDALARSQIALDEFKKKFAELNSDIRAISAAIAIQVKKDIDSELVSYRSLIEAERIQTAALKEEYSVRQNMAALTSKIRAEELAARRTETIATNVGYQQELDYRIRTDKLKAEADTNYAALTAQLRAEELAGQEAVMVEITEAVLAEANLRLRIEKETLATTVALEKEAARERVMAQRAAQAELSGAAYLAGGYAGGRAARSVTSLSATTIGVLGIAAATYEVARFTLESEKAARTTTNLAAAIGITWEQARHLEEVATITGVSLNTLEQASGRIAVALDSSSTAGRDLAKALAEIGVTGHSSGELILNFLNYLSQIPDQTTRIAEARRVLGRGSADMEKLVSGLVSANVEISKLGPGLDSALGTRLTEYNKGASLLAITWARFKDSIASFAAPGLDAIFTGITGVLTGQSSGSVKGTLKEPDVLKTATEVNPINLLKMAYYELTKAKGAAHEEDKKTVVTMDDIINQVTKLSNIKRLGSINTGDIEALRKELQDAKGDATASLKRASDVSGVVSEPEKAKALDAYDKASARAKQLQFQIDEMQGKIDKANQTAQGKNFSDQEANLRADLKHTIAQYDIAHPEPVKESGMSELEYVYAKVHSELARLQYVHDQTNATLRQIEELDPGNKAHKVDSSLPIEVRASDDTLQEGQARGRRELQQANERAKEESRRKDLEYTEQDQHRKAKLEEDFQKAVENYIEMSTKDQLNADEITLKSKESSEKRKLTLVTNAIEYQQKTGRITAADAVRLIQEQEKASDAAELADIERQKKALGNSQYYNSEELAQVARLEARKKELEDAATLRKQKLDQRPKSALDNQLDSNRAQTLDVTSTAQGSTKSLQLALDKINLDLATARMRGFGGVAGDVVTDIYAQFNKLGGLLANMLTEPHKKFKKDLQEFVKSIEKDLIATVAGSLAKLGLGKLIDVIDSKTGGHLGSAGQTAAQKQVHTDTINSTQATHDETNATENNTQEEVRNTTALEQLTQAIYALIAKLQAGVGSGGSGPSVGKAALAGGVGGFASGVGKVLGTVAAIAGMALLDSGGESQKHGLAILQQGEITLTPDVSDGLRSMMKNGSLGNTGNSRDTVHLHLHGHFSDSEIDHIQNRITKRGRRTGAQA